MRKIFSLIAAVLFAGSMMADKYVKVTTAPADWAGQYLIVYEGDNTHAAVAFNGGLTTLDAVENGVAVTIANGEIAGSATLTAAEFTIAAVEGGYSVQAASGKYIGATAYANSLVASDDAIVNKLDALVPAVVLEGGTVTMKYNYANNQLRFRYYKSGQQNVALYKLEAGSTPTVAKPVIAGDESFEESATVTITCATEGAAIYYTLDGVDPSENSLEYTAPFTITATTTVKAIAYVAAEGTYSAIASKTFTKEEPAVLVQYEVAEAIAAGLTDGTEIEVRGVITKMELKGTNFKKYGSVNIYVADATGAAGEFEFYNCYSMNADTFKVTVPASAAESTTFTEITEVSDANGYAIHVGDTVIAHGNYKLYNSTHELNTGCYIVYAKVPGALYPTNIENAATEQKAVKFFENGQLFINKNGVIYNAQGTIVR